MADITDPQVISFNNNYLRPLAEALRDLQAVATDAKNEYLTIVEPILAGYADVDVLVDGRAAEGVYQVTKADIAAQLGELDDVLTELNIAGHDATRAKFTVRPLRVR